MTFTPKQWQNKPNVTTPVNGAGLTDLEIRLAAYTDSRAPFVSVKEYGAKGDGTTDDRAAIQAALTAAAGGVVFFPAGTYRVATVEASGSLQCPDGTVVMGVGHKSVVDFDGTLTNSSANGFTSMGTTARLVVRDIAIVGPDINAAGSSLFSGVFHSGSSGGTVIVDGCKISGCMYAVRAWSNATTRVEVTNTVIIGRDGLDPGSMGIHFTGAPGASVYCNNVDFTKTGEDSDKFHQHCIYVSDETAMHIENCQFDDVAGRYIQWHGSMVANAPAYCRIIDCWFGPNIPNDVQGIVTNEFMVTEIRGCTFEAPGVSILIEGDVDISNCTFTGNLGSVAFYPHIQVEAAAEIMIRGCVFRGNNQYGIKLVVSGAFLALRDCVFTGTVNYWVNYESGVTGTFEATGCLVLNGGPLASTSTFISTRAAVSVRLRGNTFRLPGNIMWSNTNTASFYAFLNECTQGGAATANTVPTTRVFANNWGAGAPV